MSRLSQYSFISSNLKAKISKILSEDYIQKLVDAPNINAALLLLKDTDYEFLNPLYEQTADINSCEIALFEKDIDLHKDVIKKLSKVAKNFCETLTLKYEIDVLKQAIRLWFDRVVRGRDISKNTLYLYRETIVHKLPIDLIVNAENFSSVINCLKGHIYYKTLKDLNIEDIELNSIYIIEFALDKLYFTNLIEATNTLTSKDKKVALNYIASVIDIENLNRVVRLKHYYNFKNEKIKTNLLPGGNKITEKSKFLQGENEFNLFEFVQKEMPEYSPLITSTSTLLVLETIIKALKRRFVSKVLCGDPWTIGILFVYFIDKKEEIEKIITILNAKNYNLNYDRIKELV